VSRLVTGLLLAAAFVVGLVYATASESRVACEVCLDFKSDSACRTARAATRGAAVQSATTAACAVLSAGVTEGMECDRTPPRSVTCEGA